MNRTRITAGLAGLAILALAGCGSAQAAGTATPKAPAAPVAAPYNPVTILKLASAIPDPGETAGSAGGFGIGDNQVADGQFRPGQRSGDVMGNAEYVTVITSLTEADHAATLKAATPQDAQAIISGPHLSVIIVNGAKGGVAWGSPAEHGPSPQQIAAHVGGTVVSQH